MSSKTINSPAQHKNGSNAGIAGIIGGKINETLNNLPLKAATKAKIGLLNERVINTAHLAFEKAVAHLENPSMYPLPQDNKSVERAFYNLLQALPNNKRNKIVDKINLTLKASPEQRAAKYKDIVNINFKSAMPVIEQVKSMQVPDSLVFTGEEGDELVKQAKTKAENLKKKDNTVSSKAVPRQAAAAGKVSFILDNMTCLNPDDVRKDEISLGGFSIDSGGNNLELTPFFVGKFRKNETVLIGADKSKLFTFKLDPLAGAQSFTAGLFVIESDWVSNQDLVDKLSVLFIALGLLVTLTAIALMIVSAFVAPVISVATAYLLVAISSVLMDLGIQFIPLIGDDISFDTTDTLLVEGALNIGDTIERTLQIGKGFDISSTFDGKYTAAARWVGEA